MVMSSNFFPTLVRARMVARVCACMRAVSRGPYAMGRGPWVVGLCVLRRAAPQRRVALRVRVRARVRACVRACVRVCMPTWCMCVSRTTLRAPCCWDLHPRPRLRGMHTCARARMCARVLHARQYRDHGKKNASASCSCTNLTWAPHAVYPRIHARMHMHACTCTHAHTHACMHTPTHIHTRTQGTHARHARKARTHASCVGTCVGAWVRGCVRSYLPVCKVHRQQDSRRFVATARQARVCACVHACIRV